MPYTIYYLSYSICANISSELKHFTLDRRKFRIISKETNTTPKAQEAKKLQDSQTSSQCYKDCKQCLGKRKFSGGAVYRDC